MAFGDSGVLDNFNRANGALGASWSSPVYSGDGALVVSGNQCTPNAAGFHDSAWGTSFGADQEVFATVVSKNANTDIMYLFARLVNLNGASLDGYILIVTVASGTDTWELRRIDNAVETTLGASFTQEIGAGDAIGLRCNGTSIEAWYRASGGSWTQLATRTDGTYNASGQIGLGANTASTPLPVFDDFGGGVIVDDVIEQEGFRFGADDGSESAHGWLAAQDTNVTQPLSTNVLLRMLVNVTTGDPGATAYTLRGQKNGSGGYTAIPIGATTEVTPLIESGDATGTAIGTAAATWAINFPAASNGDLIIAIVAWDDSTNVTSVTAPNGPNSESPTSIQGPVASASTEMRLQAWRWVATGAWSAGTLTFTPAASETCRAVVIRIPAGEFDATTPIGNSGNSASTGTTESNLNSPAFTAGASDGPGRLVIAYGSDADAITAPASGTSTVNNATGGGVGLCVVTRNTAVSDSESIAAITATIASDSWAALAFVVRAPTVTNQIYVAPSSNIAGGGEATTARLTAPSGKTTSDFVTGRRWDDENGTDTIDIASLDYTEVEWCLRTQSPAVDTDYWDFRVYAGETALATYTVTPRWTVGTDAQAITPTLAAAQTTVPTPAVTTGPVDVAPALIAAATQVFSPAVSGSESNLAPALIAAATQVFSPTVSAGAVAIAPALLAAQTTVATPAVTPGAVSLAPALLAGAGQVFAPTVANTKTVAPAFFGARTAGSALRFFGGGNSSTVDKVYIPCAPGDPINVGQGDFTIEFWVKAPTTLAAGSATAGANYSWINSPIIFDRDLLGDVGSGGDWGVSMTGGAITFGVENSAGAQRTIIGTTDLRDNAWHHVAITRQRSTGDLAIYVDGDREAVQASGPSGDVHVASDAAASTWNEYMCLGGEKHAIDWPAGQWVGRLDEVRVSTNLRYTGTTYTVPTAPFLPDANTVGLFHLDDGSGTTVTDASASAAHGSFTVGGSGPGPAWEASAAPITVVSAVFTPTVAAGAATLAPALLAGATQVFTPTVAPGAVSVAPTLAAAQTTVPTPAVTPGAVAIAPALLAAQTTVATPTVAAGAVAVAPALVAGAGQVFAPTLTTGPVAVAPALLTVTPTVPAPTVQVGASFIEPALLVVSPTLYAPTLTTGAVSMAPALLAAATQVFTPVVSAGESYVVPDLLPAGTQVLTPALTTGPVTVTPVLVAGQTQVLTPVISAGDSALAPALLTVTPNVFAPTVTPGAVTVTPALVAGATTVYTPALAAGAVTISVPALAGVSVVPAPFVSQGALAIEVALLPASTTVYGPVVWHARRRGGGRATVNAAGATNGVTVRRTNAAAVASLSNAVDLDD